MFRCKIPVLFNDIDYAGVVYHTVYINYFHETLESFFREHWGLHGLKNLMLKQRIGLPLINIQCDFYKPLFLGQEILIEMSLIDVGKKSISFRYRGLDPLKEAIVKAECRVTQVAVCLDTGQSLTIPDIVKTLVTQELT